MKHDTPPGRPCLLQDREAGPCGTPEGPLPLCARHRDDLNRRFATAIPEPLRANFLAQGETAFLFNHRNGTVYALNATGTFLFGAWLGGCDFCGALERLADRYACGAEAELIEDGQAFWESLRDEGLLQGDHAG